MNIEVIGLVPYGDSDSLTTFLGEHTIAHNGIDEAMIDLLGIDPINVPLETNIEQFLGGRNTDWLLTHYQVHTNISAILGLTGLPDLADVDLKDEQQFYDWMDAHNAEHQKINLILGLL